MIRVTRSIQILLLAGWLTLVSGVYPAQFAPARQQINIVILSPIPGSLLTGNVSILGAAQHPQFSQYQLEVGPSPNPNNEWYPISTGVTPVANGLLGTWNTLTAGDGLYHLRLRVLLRDGTALLTTVNNVRVQNAAPTPVPTATQSVNPPIAAFTANPLTGTAPLTVNFANQSSGVISRIQWNFGDGTTSLLANPVYSFSRPGIHVVTLTVTGAGGSSTVSQPIVVQNAAPILTPTPLPDPPVAAFYVDRSNSYAPFTANFSSRSSGRVDSYLWYFGDGTFSNDQNPSHVYSTPGIYTVILTVSGPGGQSSAQESVTAFAPVPTTVPAPAVPAPVAAFDADRADSYVPFTTRFTNQSTGQITSYLWDFGDGTVSNAQNAEHVYAIPGLYTVTLTVSGPGGQSIAQTPVRASLPPTPTFEPMPPQSVLITAQLEISEDETGESQLIHTDNLWIGANESGGFAGLRFNNVQIPSGARILSAHLELYLLADRYETLDLVLAGENSDNSVPFTNDNPPEDRPPTAQQIRLRVEEPWLQGDWQELGDLAPAVQEIVSRPGWLSGNSLSILIGIEGSVQDPRWVSGYLDFPELAPRLVIVYQIP